MGKKVSVRSSHVQTGIFGTRLEILEALRANLDYMMARSSQYIHVYQFSMVFNDSLIEDLDGVMDAALLDYQARVWNQKLRLAYHWLREYGTYLSDRMPRYTVILFIQGNNFLNAARISEQISSSLTLRLEGRKPFVIQSCPSKKFAYNGGMKVMKGYASKSDVMKWSKSIAHTDKRYDFGCQRAYGYSEDFLKGKR